MDLIQTFAALISLAALFSYINHRFIKLPTTIGLLVISLLLSLALIGLGKFGFPLESYAQVMLKEIDFNKALMQGMLSALLFAGALHVSLEDLKKQKWIVAILASVGMLSSTVMVGFASYYVFALFDLNIPFIYCLLFGSLISPTDPIAVLGILKHMGAPKTLETKIAGESLFNDGFAVVVFIVLLGIAAGGGDEPVSASSVLLLFLQEAVGGVGRKDDLGFNSSQLQDLRIK